MGKIVIFGGTFDPITVEHVNVCKNLCLAKGVEKVLVVPTFLPPHKAFDGAGVLHRINMLKLALAGIDKVEISLFETDLERVCYSYETVEHFSKIYPDKKLCFAMGTDMLATFSEWKNPERIIAKAEIIHVKRLGGGNGDEATKNFIKKYGNVISELTYVGKDVSSSMLKVYKMLDLDYGEFTLPSVAEYIRKNNLYPKNRFYDYICQVLPAKRRKHTAGVVLYGKKLAKKTGADEKKAEIACLLHDNAKYLDYKRYPFFSYEPMPKNVVHQFLGASIAEHILGIDDEEILNAIRYHTTGRPNMGLLEKVVFTADVIEMGRNYDGVEKLRKEVDLDFEKGFCNCVIDLYKVLCLEDEKPYYLTVEAYKFYKEELYGN